MKREPEDELEFVSLENEREARAGTKGSDTESAKITSPQPAKIGKNGENGAENGSRTHSLENEASTGEIIAPNPSNSSAQSSPKTQEEIIRAKTPPLIMSYASVVVRPQFDNDENEESIQALRNEIAATKTLIERKAKEWDCLMRLKKAKELELERRLRGREVAEVESEGSDSNKAASSSQPKATIRVANLPMEPPKAALAPLGVSPRHVIRKTPLVFNTVQQPPRPPASQNLFIINNSGQISQLPSAPVPVGVAPTSVVMTTPAVQPAIIPSSRPIDVSLGSLAAQQLLMAQRPKAPVLLVPGPGGGGAGNTITLPSHPVASAGNGSMTTTTTIVVNPDGSSSHTTNNDSGLRIESVHSAADVPSGGSDSNEEIGGKKKGKKKGATWFECDHCQHSFKKLLQCMGCNQRFFCSTKCQAVDWETHHEVCGE